MIINSEPVHSCIADEMRKQVFFGLKRITLFILIALFPVVLSAQNSFVSWDENGLLLDNGRVSRYIAFEENGIKTISLRIPAADYNLVQAGTPEPRWLLDKNSKYKTSRTGADPLEFSMKLNDKQISGLSDWMVEEVEPVTQEQGKGAVIHLTGNGLELQVAYLLYPELPVIRKKIRIINRSGSEIKLEDLDVESLNIAWGNTHNLIYHNYARYKWLGPFTGNWDDPLVAVQDQSGDRGLLLGNEAPGIVKRTSVCLDGRTISVGLTHQNQDYPFRVWLEDGEMWDSPWTFIIPYKGKNPDAIIETELDDFVRKHMGIRLAELKKKPAFVYNTWNPFRTEINDALIMELADAAAACGVEEFVIDDGWQTNRGDWKIDYEKFPDGLKPVFDYIKSKGMKPGLWLALATVNEESKVYQNHPEWVVRYKDGSPMNVHGNEPKRYTVCMTTGWKDYIKEVLLNLVKEHGLEYVKLDLAVVTGAYMFDRSRSGCYAEGHNHKDREESLLEIYRRTWQLFDELHEEAPELFIDCTFETMGALQTIDYDMCKHAEGNWLSNFEEPAPEGSLRVRQMGWWRSGVIPATALVVGNQTMDDPGWEFSFQSLIGTLPIVLGDPRKVSEADQQKMKAWAEWMNEMQNRYNYMMFRQDLPGFGEPAEGRWDGWSRINTESREGGIIGIFKQGSPEKEQTVRINRLNPGARYEIKTAPDGKVVGTKTGKELREEGFSVKIKEDYGAGIYSVGLVP